VLLATVNCDDAFQHPPPPDSVDDFILGDVTGDRLGDTSLPASMEGHEGAIHIDVVTFSHMLHARFLLVDFLLVFSLVFQFFNFSFI
jgi:hypothetical protein